MDHRDIAIIAIADQLVNKIEFEADMEANTEDVNSPRMKKLRRLYREACELKKLLLSEG